jgi:septum formation protein
LFLKSPPPLILGSTSVYRRELLSRLKIPFECHSPGVDETPQPGERAVDLVVRLARLKAQAVAERHPDAWVIGSDQVALLPDAAQHGRILGKPGTAAKCVEQLQACSGRTLAFITAVAVVNRRTAALVEFVDTTRVTYRHLDPATIERYVSRESPLDCAGGFKSEALGITLCESIESDDPTGLIGLPLIRLSAVLRDAGFDLP